MNYWRKLEKGTEDSGTFGDVTSQVVELEGMELYDNATRIAWLTISFVYYVTGVIGNSLIIWTISRQK